VFSRGVWDYLNFVLGFSNPKPGFSSELANFFLIPRKKVGGFLIPRKKVGGFLIPRKKVGGFL